MTVADMRADLEEWTGLDLSDMSDEDVERNWNIALGNA